MRACGALLVITLWLACGASETKAENPERKCPVVVERVDLSYNHQGRESKPQLTIGFGNFSAKQITAITFILSVLDGGGYPHLYPDDLTYRESLESGKRKEFLWELPYRAVDIHRTGEMVVVKQVQFADRTSWIDDGSESCAYTVDFHAR
jgi:hypothetical protein